MESAMSMVVYEVEESVATVRLNGPDKLNAFTYEMIDAIRAAVDRAAADDRVVGIVITGSGRGFSAGLDAADLARSAEAGPPPSTSRRPTTCRPSSVTWCACRSR